LYAKLVDASLIAALALAVVWYKFVPSASSPVSCAIFV
jgi:hypothetical protein